MVQVCRFAGIDGVLLVEQPVGHARHLPLGGHRASTKLRMLQDKLIYVLSVITNCPGGLGGLLQRLVLYSFSLVWMSRIVCERSTTLSSLKDPLCWSGAVFSAAFVSRSFNLCSNSTSWSCSDNRTRAWSVPKRRRKKK